MTHQNYLEDILVIFNSYFIDILPFFNVSNYCMYKNPQTEILTVYELCDNCFGLKTFVQIIGLYSASLCFNLANRKKNKKNNTNGFVLKKPVLEPITVYYFQKRKTKF